MGTLGIASAKQGLWPHFHTLRPFFDDFGCLPPLQILEGDYRGEVPKGVITRRLLTTWIAEYAEFFLNC
jgi:hypothetical protein